MALSYVLSGLSCHIQAYSGLWPFGGRWMVGECKMALKFQEFNGQEGKSGRMKPGMDFSTTLTPL